MNASVGQSVAKFGSESRLAYLHRDHGVTLTMLTDLISRPILHVQVLEHVAEEELDVTTLKTRHIIKVRAEACPIHDVILM